MQRGLRESLEYAFSVVPDLLSENELAKRFSPMISKCILAANRVRLGENSERDLATLIYGNDDVPPSTLRRLISRTQQELEAVTSSTASSAAPDEQSFRSNWLSLISMYTAGVDAYFLRQQYRAQERLSSIMSIARDPYMLPISISSGLFLSFHMAQNQKHSRVLQTMNVVKRNLDALNDCWEWMMVYSELQSIMRRRYRATAYEPRVAEINTRLNELIDGPIDELSPQAQMIAATCAYLVSQSYTNHESTIRWADVYKRASFAVNRESQVYSLVADRMYLSVFIVTKQYSRAIPILEKMIASEVRSSKASKRPVDVTFYSWLADAFLWEGRYDEVISMIDAIRPGYLAAAAEGVRVKIMIQRSLALALSGKSTSPIDRRVSRIAMLRNESSDRRSGDNALRVQALMATLIGSILQESTSKFTPTDVIEKLQFIQKTYSDVKSCKRTIAFIRLIALLESTDPTRRIPQRRAQHIEKLLDVLLTNSNYTVYEIVSYPEIARRLYPEHIASIRPSLLASEAVGTPATRDSKAKKHPKK